MVQSAYDWLVLHKSVLEALAATATFFALFVPLPIFVLSSLIRRRAEARERAYALIERLQTEDNHRLREHVASLTQSGELLNYNSLSANDKAAIRRLMNENELIGFHINASRIERDIFFRYWRQNFIYDWNRLAPIVMELRAQTGSPRLYVEWERAVATAKKDT